MKSIRHGKPPNLTAAPVSVEDAAALHQAGRHDEAEAAYRELLKGPVAQRRIVLQLFGLMQRQRGRPVDALSAYDQLLALGERSADVFLARGDLLHGLGRNTEALQSYERAVQIDPRRAEALNNRGAVLEALGRRAEALASYEAALRVRPAYVEALYNRGAAQGELGQRDAALASYEAALALRPHHAYALNNRGLILASMGRHPEACDSLDAALAVQPSYAEAWNNRSVSLRRLGQAEAALASAESALELRRDYPEALNSRGLALAALINFDGALESYACALRLRPQYPEALSNTGLALVALGQIEEALQRFDAALAIDPCFAEAEFNSSLALLRLGRFAEGYRRHEARWRRPGQPGPTYPDETLWLGGEDVAGRTVLLHAEQGLGDTLQFCRFAPRVADLGARVILQAPPALKALLTGLPGVAETIATGEPLPAFDRHIPLMSLPLALGAEADPSPDPPYLTADPLQARSWRQRLSARGEPLVGLVWSGNPAHENDRNRSIPVHLLAPLLTGPARFVTLQKEVRADDSERLAGWPELLRVEDQLRDFTDTAALAAACDLVISVDTSVAHLAGALGRPVWILLPALSDWRWRTGTADGEPDRSTWYPSALLFRQRRFGDWAEVVNRVAARLSSSLR